MDAISGIQKARKLSFRAMDCTQSSYELNSLEQKPHLGIIGVQKQSLAI